MHSTVYNIADANSIQYVVNKATVLLVVDILDNGDTVHKLEQILTPESGLFLFCRYTPIVTMAFSRRHHAVLLHLSNNRIFAAHLQQREA